MGKLALFLVLATLLGGGLVMMQSNTANKTTEEDQAERQMTILAREIARTGLNAIYAKARVAEDGSETAQELIDGAGGYDEDNPLVEEYEGGEYAAWIETTGPFSYDVFSIGRYILDKGEDEEGNPIADTLTHRLFRSGFLDEEAPDVPDTPECEERQLEICSDDEGNPVDEFDLHAGFIDSRAGWCSAIYLDQYIPDSEEESGYRREIDMVFDSGHYRDGDETQFAQTLVPGTQMNFILAVDQNCSSENEAGIAWNDPTFTHHHWALEIDVEQLDEMTEGVYSMVEKYPNGEKWRIRFEDQNFYEEEQYLDIKRNGYGDENWGWECSGGWWTCTLTWGGDGWDYDGNGLTELRDYGSQPDYSDQVFWIELQPHVDPEEEDPPA